MSAMNGGSPELATPMNLVDRETVAQDALRAMRSLLQKVATESNGAEAKDWSAAFKSVADGYVVLDPTLTVEGVPLAEQAAEAERDRMHKLELERVRAQQAAPAQKRRKLKISRSEGGGTDYEMEG